MTGKQERIEWLKCSQDVAYFADTYVWIFNATQRSWIKLILWAAQLDVLDQLVTGRNFLVLKARQLGLTWLCLSYALWLMLFRPAAVVLLFSKRDDEAEELLSRLKGMYDRLPSWMQARAVVKTNSSEFQLSNGSRAMCFPTTGGRSYTGTFVLGDEADYIPDLNGFLNAVKPTVDAGGQLVLITTSDKTRPQSTFKSLFRAAWQGINDYVAVFLPWHARPDRTQDWYNAIARDMRAQDGSDDNLHQEYPETPEQALAAKTLDKRIPPQWVANVTYLACALPSEQRPVDAPDLHGLRLFRKPDPRRSYVVGVDPAEGNPTSDDSALCVLDVESGEQVAVLSAKMQPGFLAGCAAHLAVFYNDAGILVERNNHGHSVLLWLADNGVDVDGRGRFAYVLNGLDGKPGWVSSTKGKALMYADLADGCRDGQLSLHDPLTVEQVTSIEGSSLRAPQGMHDDAADAVALAWVAVQRCDVGGGVSSVIGEAPPDPIEQADESEEW